MKTRVPVLQSAHRIFLFRRSYEWPQANKSIHSLKGKIKLRRCVSCYSTYGEKKTLSCFGKRLQASQALQSSYLRQGRELCYTEDQVLVNAYRTGRVPHCYGVGYTQARDLQSYGKTSSTHTIPVRDTCIRYRYCRVDRSHAIHYTSWSSYVKYRRWQRYPGDTKSVSIGGPCFMCTKRIRTRVLMHLHFKFV